MPSTLLPLIAAVLALSPPASPQIRVIEAKAYLPPSKVFSKADCILFVMRDCPIGDASSPEYKRIASKYSAKGVRFYLAFSEPGIGDADARTHAKSFALDMTCVLDSDGLLAKRFGATRSPEAVVILPSGEVAYRGRIDDLYAKWGVRRPKATKHDLQIALDQVLAGKPVSKPRTEVVGCILSASTRPKE